MSVDLIYKLNGALDEGINVYDLSPMLLSYAKIIDEAYKELYPEAREIAVNIKPFARGSFEINILVLARHDIVAILNFLSSDSGKLVEATLTYLGFLQATTGITLMSLIERLRGKCSRIEPLASDEFRYYSDDNQSVTVSRQVHSLYQNCTIQQNFYSAVGRPLEMPGVESVESYVKNREQATKVVQDAGIVPAIKSYSSGNTPSIEELHNETVHTILVHPKRGSWEGEKGHWSFRTGQDSVLSVSSILDEEFLAKVRDGSIRLAANDTLLIEVRERQSIRDGELTMTCEVLKVIDYHEAPRTGTLALG